MESENFSEPQKLFSGELPDEDIRIKIVGVGGAGTNAVDRLKLENFERVRLATIDTDAQSLSSSPLEEKVMIGRGLTMGLSTGSDAELGRKAAERDKERLAKVTNGTDLVFLLAGLGRGTGSGAAPVVAQAASEQGALVVAFVTQPFTLEGARPQTQCEEALSQLRAVADAVIPLPNDILLQQVEESATVLDAFARSDVWVSRAVRSVCSMLFRTGLINLDFAALRSTFVNRGGRTLFGIGEGQGEDAVRSAINDLMFCPLLHMPERPRRADNLLVNIVGGPGLSMRQVNDILQVVTDKFCSRDNTVLGAVIDDAFGEKVEICVIGTTDVQGRKLINQYMGKGGARPAAVKPVAAAPHGVRGTQAKGAARAAEPPQLDEAPPVPYGPANTGERPVHRSKLQARVDRDPDSQSEFRFVAEEEQRGYFDKTERNLWNGEDLDVPTFLRRGIKVPVG